MNLHFRPLALLLWMLLAAGSTVARAQWLTQTNVLKAGWNAVYLHVDASHDSIGTLLASDPNASIEEIWLWMPSESTEQFVQSPQNPTPAGPQWSTWIRTQASTSPLQNLIPNAAYLVRVRDEVATYQWELKGKPVALRYRWTTSGLNFVGFPTVPSGPPSFDDFLAQVPFSVRSEAQIFRYPGGPLGEANPVEIFGWRSVPVTRGEAYWMRAGEFYNSHYGPLEVVANAGILDFGDSGRAISLRLRNKTTNQLTATLNLTASETPPGTNVVPTIPPLMVRGALDQSTLLFTYSNLVVGAPMSWTLAPAGQQGSEAEVAIGLNRSTLTGSPGEIFAAVLRFTESLGQTEVDLGVSAALGANTGLWVGSAAVTQVGQYLKSYARDAANNPITTTNGTYRVIGTNTSLGNVPATYPLRLIVHNPAAGHATLFQRVYIGVNSASNAIVSNQEEALNRNFLAEARRISATHLPFTQANPGWSLSGLLSQGGTVTASVTNRFTEQASNPFLHRYHPDHDNLDARFQAELPQGSESYSIVRDITLQMTPPADDFNSRIGASESLTGQYEETIRVLGLARAGNTFDTRTFQVRGIFTLNRISEIATVTPATHSLMEWRRRGGLR